MKFRIWDKESKCFFNGNAYFVNSDGEILIVGVLGEIYHENKENFVIQQDTGLIDLYGNPLFEGDLVELYYHHANITANRYEIRYSLGRWMLDEEKSLTELWLDNTKFGDVCRVVKVGNIFQNK